MSQHELCDFLSKLLNRVVGTDTPIVLASAQRARFLSWIEGRVVDIEGVRRSVSGRFSVAELAVAAEAIDDTGGRGTPTGSESAHDKSLGAFGGVLGVGIDIQSISEVIPYGEAFDFRCAPELSEIFSAREISYACGKEKPRQTLAGLFAAKEAIIKANPEMARRKLREIEVLPNENGVPTSPGFRVSISHSGEYAVAMAIYLGTNVWRSSVAQPSPTAKEGYARVTMPTSDDATLRTGVRGGRWFVVAAALILAAAAAICVKLLG